MNRDLEEASIQASRANEKKSEFLQDMTHQIRTPLNIINGFTQVLRDNYEQIPQEEIDDVTRTMQTNAINIHRMVSMLVVASSAGRETKVDTNEKVNIKGLVAHLTDIYNTNPPHTVELQTQVNVSDDYCLKTNCDYLTKILGELLYNAKKFTAEGYVRLAVKADELKVTFTVEDTGQGISPEVREQIFSTFEKGNIFSEGLGLGLTVCRQMARMIGGDLILDNTSPQGSRFLLMIPDADAWMSLR